MNNTMFEQINDNDIKFYENDETFINWLCSELRMMDSNVKFAGFNKPHPQDDFIIVRLILQPNCKCTILHIIRNTFIIMKEKILNYHHEAMNNINIES